MNITERQLYRWISHQRERCDDPRRRALLEKIPGWTWNPNGDSWDKHYQLTLKHGIVESRFILPDGTRLGQWQGNMRLSYKRNNTAIMTPERKKLLEKIPGWVWDIEDASWYKQYQLSLKHGVVEQKFTLPDGTNLGKWQSHMRENGGNNKFMTPERKKLLEKIPGWVWNKYDAIWNRNYELSLNHGMVGRSFRTPDGTRLGLWQVNMRTNYFHGTNGITPERKKLLEKIPGWTKDLQKGVNQFTKSRRK